MRSNFSAKRWISVFANVQDTATLYARNVIGNLLTYLQMQEGRMTCLGESMGYSRPCFAKPSMSCHTPNHPLVSTGTSKDRRALGSW
ncbi:MAG: hypothetical protein ACKN85_11060 [Pirellula sp.]|jgi:hypothetical protein|nr:hypothetical protein [Planctomycetota bacterium]